ncbi:GNAT family N-acetyltransferase [Nanchangia anserum]|uniref:GNAT family N-acetyltransferase n=1 Tax=Nanchangia anserum TaxID=2692125 RepID=A0A8I0KPF1_9ACTO|nr:GNAT family N-acetyltransferase [Nanchangia anserum]MBD3688835.1 GNAT family N-acetyltransferase [Nanchangia anserum]QOX81109.1 GNAT family N-acetyltransferase [Nanchangia anserum]
MSQLPDGVQRVDLDGADTRRLAVLVEAIETHDNPPYRTSPDEIDRWFRPHSGSRCSGWVAAGELIAYAHVQPRSMDAGVITCQGGVAPHWRDRGLGEASSQWQTATATRILRESPGGGGRIVTHVEGENTRFEAHVSRLGYTRSHTYEEWTRPLSLPLEDYTVPSTIDVTMWRDELSDKVRRALNQMGETLGATPLSADQWLETMSAFLPEASVVALDRSSDRSPVVGFLIASIYSQDWDALGQRQGYIDMYGLDGEHQGQGIVRAMITEAVRSFTALGLDTVAISSADTEAAARQLLRDLGFDVASVSHEYILDVEPA